MNRRMTIAATVAAGLAIAALLGGCAAGDPDQWIEAERYQPAQTVNLTGELFAEYDGGLFALQTSSGKVKLDAGALGNQMKVGQSVAVTGQWDRTNPADPVLKVSRAVVK